MAVVPKMVYLHYIHLDSLLVARIKLAKLRRQGNYLQVEEMLHQEIVTGPEVQRTLKIRKHETWMMLMT